MTLARDLNELISPLRRRDCSGRGIGTDSAPCPGNPLPDLSTIEACRSQATGAAFKFYPRQLEKIAGTLAGLKAKSRVWMACEMGCGKSPMSLAAAWTLLKHRSFRLLVMCPGPIVRKWRREVEWAIPGVVYKIIPNFTDLLKFEEMSKRSKAPMVAVIGKTPANWDLMWTGRPRPSAR